MRLPFEITAPKSHQFPYSNRQVKSSQVKLPLIKTSDNRTSITCRNGNKIAKTSNIKLGDVPVTNSRL